jgi:hypothetical protein
MKNKEKHQNPLLSRPPREARWVDISEHLQQHPECVVEGPFSIEAPATNLFSASTFPHFVKRFRRSVLPATRVSVTPNLLIRPWGQRMLIQPASS